MSKDRPFIKCSIDQLETKFKEVSSSHDAVVLKELLNELTYRKTPRAKKLWTSVKEALGAGSAGKPSSAPIPPGNSPGSKKPSQRFHSPSTSPQKRAHVGKHKPTSEQSEAIDAFLKGGSLKINAYAGTGKTSTLEMLAHATTSRGQYIAFNRDIVRDAKEKFPESVNCSTTHGLAFRATPTRYRSCSEKMTGKVNANKLVELLGIKKNWRIDKDHTLKPLSQGSIILKTLQRFTQSADPEPISTHVPRHGSLATAPESTVKAVEEFAISGARHLWERMQDPSDPIPLGHDGYLKLWALSDPTIAADFILLDEAQDTNPVVLDVLSKQDAQMIYVGDKYQQIYEWRGAVNAMEKIATDSTTLLTKSFRFGEAIAEAATNVLAMLGEKVPIVGNPSIKSRIGPTSAQTVLARTNASTITAIIDAIDRNLKPHLVGGNCELMEMLRGVQDLKRGEPSTVPDFFGFQNWEEVVGFAKSDEGEHLLTFVNLVESRSERQLMWALNRTVQEENCDIIISTAHKAKGREWSKVRLMDDFLKSQPRRKNQLAEIGRTKGHDPAELRLFYVAMTRAREEIEIAHNVMSHFGFSPDTIAYVQHSTTVKSTPVRVSANFSSDRPKASTVSTEWEKPKNWEPGPKKVPPDQPQQVEPAQPKKRSILDWFFRK